MKKISILLATIMTMIFATFTMASNQEVKTEKFKVYGNCGMCENRIESTVKAIDGVSTAEWDKDTKMIEVTFDGAKTDIHKIHMAIADAGHDTDMHRAKDEIYNNLPGCCQYERAPMKNMDMKNDHSDAHSSCKSKSTHTSGKSCCSK